MVGETCQGRAGQRSRAAASIHAEILTNGIYMISCTRGQAPRQEGSRWRLAETLFVQKGVIIVTDYELLALVLMIIAIVVSLIDKNGR